MKLRADQTGDRGLPMPLWLQGALETAQAAIISALVVIAPVLAVWATAGFHDGAVEFLARLAGQSWLLVHGVPLELTAGSRAAANSGSGLLSLIPLGLTLIPFLLAWRAGRRLARASYTDQLWQALLGSWLVYAAFGTAPGSSAGRPTSLINPWHAMFIPLIPYALGMVIGARREAGSWSRLIGVDAVDWISRTSQHSRWAGSYLAPPRRPVLWLFCRPWRFPALLLAVDLFIHWNLVVAVYEALDAGAVGGAALTIAQLGFLPNLVVFALAWAQVQVLPWASVPRWARWAPPWDRCLPSRCWLPSRPAPWITPSLPGSSRSSPVSWPAGGSSAKAKTTSTSGSPSKLRARWFTATVSTLLLGVLVAAGCRLAGRRPDVGGARIGRDRPPDGRLVLTRCGRESGWLRKLLPAS
jgi:hypothetical protein